MNNDAAQEVLPPKNFGFTTEQKQLLMEHIAAKGRLLIGFQFNTPDQDQSMLRQHAYIKGEFDTLNKLLDYDAQVNKAYADYLQETQQQRQSTHQPE